MQNKLLNILSNNKKNLALLIDPDKHTPESLQKLIEETNKYTYPNIILVGGSLIFSDIENTINYIKSLSNKPVYIFPGNNCDLSKNADGILLLSLISGRNADFLIGNHVIAAPKLKRLNIDIIPTGYILIDCGNATSVSYMSNTTPIPYFKNDIAAATAIAGEMLGLKAVYLEGGSGANKHISTEMIAIVKQNIDIPIFVGGGIKTPEAIKEIFDAGANMIIIGTVIEQNPEMLQKLANMI